MRKIIYFFLLIATSISCGVSETEYSNLQEKNKYLSQEVNDLKSKLDEMDYLKDHSQVMISNTELREIASTVNNQVYKVKIQLPRNYHKTSESYPVLYVTDAETNFGGIGYIVQRLIKDKLIPPIIVVGIAYGTDYKTFYKLRRRDLTPGKGTLTPGKGTWKYPEAGDAPLFCDFLSNELFPFIESNYRVSIDNRTVYGHSFGGLFGTYVLLNKSELFNNYLILSPSLWYQDSLMLDQVEQFSNNFESTKVYMASGELEPRIDEIQSLFVSKLEKRNFEGLELKAEVMENETHRTIFGRGFTDGMRYLYRE